jgi:hypothetical protein
MSGAARTRDRGPWAGRGSGWALLTCAALIMALAWPSNRAQAQVSTVVVEQVLAAGAGGLVSAPLDPARRYSLLVLSVPDGTAFHGSYSQNWFAREGARRAGSNDGPLSGRAPWEQELQPPAPALAQWTFAAGLWNDGASPLVVRIVDHGPR